jgi:hypothetical protein
MSSEVQFVYKSPAWISLQDIPTGLDRSAC